MTKDEVLAIFREAGALLEGHFILSSGRRSSVFIQKFRVFENPAHTEKVCQALADKVTARFGRIDVVVAPAIGGIVPGYEIARALGARSIFVEREDGAFQLRRGFEIHAGERVIVVEDIVTTGLSVRECLNSLGDQPGKILGVACLIDRSAGKADVGAPLVALCEFAVPDYDPRELPPELAALPAIKPGSRSVQGSKP
ncbi:MAG: orotate phosphoribosyltransferase [Alphaproteobacteria bacterium]|nr:MAG: orotate [Beijerinckiaceae bacterium]TPW00846.1 MAG: orotate phosphoribosyltransferase [Alphaproteobacteria bacterium]